MKPILEIQNLSKKYRIQHLTGGYLSLRERMTSALKFERNQTEDFWALKDVSFEVKSGESIGIIGRNGAGKSTLLKILSKITPPTKGKIISRGRIASLLEVGTGFHPELTGRENIFFNGSLLGMKRMEIADKFDEIVDFSGVEKFLDTPLKHYSSGMQLRLAFAVAAFLEPEILIIDEVLAVGDAEFQKKCLGKMEDVSKSGRTVLFVSHNLQAVMNLCRKGVYLKSGQLVSLDTIDKVIETYLSQNELVVNPSNYTSVKKVDPDFQLINVMAYQSGKEIKSIAQNGKPLEIVIHYELLKGVLDFRIFVDVSDYYGSVIFRSFHNEQDIGEEGATQPPGRYSTKLIIPSDFFAPLSYDFKISFGVHNVRMLEPKNGFSFRLGFEQTGKYNLKYHGQYTTGIICPVLPWQTIKNLKYEE